MKKSTLILMVSLGMMLVYAPLIRAQDNTFQIPRPYRIGGTVTVDGTQLKAKEKVLIRATKADGTVYKSVGEIPAEVDQIRDNGYYLLDIPTKNSSQQGGAVAGEAAVLHVLIEGKELRVTTPAEGKIEVGPEGGTKQIDIVAETPK